MEKTKRFMYDLIVRGKYCKKLGEFITYDYALLRCLTMILDVSLELTFTNLFTG